MATMLKKQKTWRKKQMSKTNTTISETNDNAILIGGGILLASLIGYALTSNEEVRDNPDNKSLKVESKPYWNAD